MDGRVQIPVIRYLQERFAADFVDVISEPGPNRILSEDSDISAVESIERRIEISVENHGSVGIAVVGHHDCAGNPSSTAEQNQHTTAAVLRIRSSFPHIPVVGLWVGDNWEVIELKDNSANNH
jgi:hypothetical protein